MLLAQAKDFYKPHVQLEYFDFSIYGIFVMKLYGL